jgi:phosphoenolpyruvate-protein kinase (PTS system EI component)
MPERVLRGAAASPGVGIGAGWRRPEAIAGVRVVPFEDRERERDTALTALTAAADALAGVAARLPAGEAEIVETGVLMARDPALSGAVEEAILSDGLTATHALIRAAGMHADALAALPDATLAARADDVRSLGRRAALLTTNGSGDSPPGGDFILIARDLGPADIAELAPSLAGVALAGGSPTSHASIVARSLGVPMITGVDPRVLEVADGAALAVDGTGGLLVIDPSPQRALTAAKEMRSRRRAEHRARVQRDQPAVTRDGRRVGVLVNVASVEELSIGLRAGAEGIGLLRTELAFLDATDWPTEEEHLAALAPILDGLGDRRAVVRALDFGADKSPPFLAGTAERGLELLLGHSDALVGQLRAILLLAAGGRDVRVLLPMVDSPEQLIGARVFLDAAARELGRESRPPKLGSMIESESAARNAAAIAVHSDFLSIGTNDLTASVLGVDRFATGAARTHDPEVLRLIARSVTAAHDAGKTIEICGEAASDPRVLPLLVGLGVDEVSVGAARVGTARAWIRRLRADDAQRLARSALAMNSAEDVERAVTSLAEELQSEPQDGGSDGSAQSSDGSCERVERGPGVGALGA